MVDVGGGLMFPDFSVSYVDLDLFNVSFIDYLHIHITFVIFFVYLVWLFL